MKIRAKTPRTEMAHQSLIAKMTSFYQPLSEELGYEPLAVDVELSRFSALSARVEFEKGEVDFALALPTDSGEEVKAKFLKYIDTEKYGVAEDAMRQIAERDLPLTLPEQSPDIDLDKAPKN